VVVDPAARVTTLRRLAAYLAVFICLIGIGITAGCGAARDEPRRVPVDRTPERTSPPQTQAPRKPSGAVGGTTSHQTPKGPERKETTVNITSGVFIIPDVSRTPIRVFEVGTRLTVLEATDEWLKVEFRDPQGGPRVGYVLRGNCTY
jgi:hypothetical protein